MTRSYTAARTFRATSPERVVTGAGALAKLPDLVARLSAERFVVATSRSIVENTPLIDGLRELLGARLILVYPGCQQHSPKATVDELTHLAREASADGFVSIGGSSVIDTVKAAASALGATTHREPPPQITISTTLSAGEFTAGAGITDESSHTKNIAIDTRVLPRFVILDPEVTVHTPDRLWLSSGLKAMDHALEALWAQRPNSFSDALAEESVRLLFEHLPRTAGSDDLEARGACQIAAWLGITAVLATGMRLSHFLSYELGSAWDIPHGETSCILLPPVMRHLAPATTDGQARIARAMGVPSRSGGPDAGAAAADALESFVAHLGMPTRISQAGGREEDLQRVAESGWASAQRLGLTSDLPNGSATLRELLERAW